MKIKRAVIENFKGIRHLELNFCDEGSEEPRQITAILGDNGSGKTSALQAIWLSLTFFHTKSKSAIGAIWDGLLLDRVSSLGETKIKTYLFDNEAKDKNHVVLDSTLFFYDGIPSATGKLPPGGSEELDKKLSNVLFFTQNRNTGLFNSQEGFKNRSIEQDWTTGVDKLRYQLSIWWSAHQSPSLTDERDYIQILEEYLNRIFPGTKMLGTQMKPKRNGERKAPSESDFYFIFERDGKRFDVAELSSGEQAVFTIMFEFVRNDIKNGIILIDELELHLHPPEQQALYNALPKIGPDCQFIITTHSSYLEDIIPDRHEIRLEGGRLCL